MSTPPKDQLSTFPNRHRNKDYSISLIQGITLKQKSFLFGLRYIPDKLLLCHDSLAAYLEQVLSRDPDTAEALANDILEDIVDQIIPRWVEVILKQHENSLGQDIVITVAESQPNWRNDDLLKRLPPVF